MPLANSKVNTSEIGLRSANLGNTEFYLYSLPGLDTNQQNLPIFYLFFLHWQLLAATVTKVPTQNSLPWKLQTLVWSLLWAFILMSCVLRGIYKSYDMVLTSQQSAQNELMILQILMLRCHSPAFNFSGEIKEGTDFWPMTQIKCNEDKNKILYWTTCFISSLFFFFPSCISLLNMETSDILL